MFKDSKAFSGFAVDDLKARPQFYGAVLGIRAVGKGGNADAAPCGRSGHARLPQARPRQPATFTILNFPVDDIDAAVDALLELAAWVFQANKMDPDENGVMRQGTGPPIAWFTDPAGNILSVLQER